jgi:hypothetical protein
VGHHVFGQLVRLGRKLGLGARLRLPAIRRGIVIYGGLLLLVLLFGSSRMGFAIHRRHRARAWHYGVGYAAELA